MKVEITPAEYEQLEAVAESVAHDYRVFYNLCIPAAHESHNRLIALRSILVKYQNAKENGKDN